MKYYLVKLKNANQNFNAICKEKIVVKNIIKNTIENLGILFIEEKLFSNYRSNFITFEDLITGKTIYDPLNHPDGEQDSALVYTSIDKVSKEEILKLLKNMTKEDIKIYKKQENEIERKSLEKKYKKELKREYIKIKSLSPNK